MKRTKTDGRDAEAICAAMQRPTMRFVTVKRVAQQAVAALHRTRALLVRQRTMATNALRAAFAEFGVVAAPGIRGVRELIVRLPAAAGEALLVLARHWEALSADIQALDTRIVQGVRADEAARRLMAIPGIGPISASALLAAVPDARLFRSGRGFAAWLGSTPARTTAAAASVAPAAFPSQVSAPSAACCSSAPVRTCARSAVAASRIRG